MYSNRLKRFLLFLCLLYFTLFLWYFGREGGFLSFIQTAKAQTFLLIGLNSLSHDHPLTSKDCSVPDWVYQFDSCPLPGTSNQRATLLFSNFCDVMHLYQEVDWSDNCTIILHTPSDAFLGR